MPGEYDTALTFDPTLVGGAAGDWEIDGTGYPLCDLTEGKLNEALLAGADEIRYGPDAALRIGDIFGKKMTGGAPV